MLLDDAQNPYRPSLFHMLFRWQGQMALWCLACAGAVAGLHASGVVSTWVTLPTFPLAIVGGALGIFVSFRTNSAYQRWWEGRKLWGRLINTSRHLCSQALAYLDPATAQAVVHRHTAYVHALRCGLQDDDPFVDADLLRCLDPAEVEGLRGSTNLNHALLNLQLRQLVGCNQAGALNDFRLSDMDESVRHLLDIQGGAERIKKTPFPPAYGFLATRLAQLVGLLLPFALVEALGWWVVLLNLVIPMAFQLINEVGRALQNPFTKFWPALPLRAMSLTIERNLRQALGEAELPPGQAPERIGSITVLR